MRPSYHSSVSICYTQEKTEEHSKDNPMGSQNFQQICGKPCSLILEWVHAASITHSEASIHLDTNVIFKNEKKMKTFFPSFHEVIEIISELYTSIGSKDLMTLQRIFRTKQNIRPLICMHKCPGLRLFNAIVKQLRNTYLRRTWSKQFSFIQFRFIARQDNHCSHWNQWQGQQKQKAGYFITFSAERAKQLPMQEIEMQLTTLYNSILQVITIHKIQLCFLSRSNAIQYQRLWEHEI